MAHQTVTVQGKEITVINHGGENYYSLTDIAGKGEEGAQLISNWLSNKNTIEYLAVWENLNNPAFNAEEYARIASEAGTRRFRLAVRRWRTQAGGIGIMERSGKTAVIYAHLEIAIEFGAWLNPVLRLLLIREAARLKEAQEERAQWDVRRILAKANYRLHTDAIKQYLVPTLPQPELAGILYASEADIINIAVFGTTARDWHRQYPGARGNMRDYASIEQLAVINSIESQNALLISQGVPQHERLAILCEQARRNMLSLLNTPSIKALENAKESDTH